MGSVKIKHTITYINDPTIQKKQFEKVLRKALKTAGEFWRDQLLKGHFTPSGAIKYGYQKRTPKYQSRKQRQKGHRVPLVWSGETRRMALRQSKPRRTIKGIKVRIPTPDYLRYKPKGWVDPLKDELVRVTQNEANNLANIVGIEQEKGLMKIRKKRIQKV